MANIQANKISIIETSEWKFLLKKGFIWLSLIILGADTLYKTWFGITMHTREKCVIYSFLPKWAFLFFEYFIELFLVVIAGIFLGTLLEKYFSRFKKYYPRNSLTAFVYASVIPVCSCSAIPLIESMKSRMPLRTIITFVVAAPLLNPYIVTLSFSVLGPVYTSLRIVSSFLVAIGTGWIVEWFYKRMGKPDIGVYKSCEPQGCSVSKKDVYEKTWNMLSRIAPYILLAGALGLLLEMVNLPKMIENTYLSNDWSTLSIAVLIGAPLYFCNGADVLFLQPLMNYTSLSMGAAMAFSLSSTAICVSSLVMLTRFIGKKLTIVVLLATIALTFLIGAGINMLTPLL